MFKSISHLVNSFDKESNHLLGDRYEIIGQIGRGAMGQVFKAKDVFAGDLIVAIKFLSEAIVNDSMRDIFEKEAKISTLLGEQSDHIVKVRDYGFDDKKTPYYVMEYLDGEDLSQMMKKKALSIAKFLSLAKQICLGLECAHNGILINEELVPIIHRDIKPSNIFLVKNLETDHFVKLLDFGIAQINSPDQTETQRRFMGTPEYCSPEQLAEDKLEPTSDIYSLGVVMYKMLCQKSPIKVPQHSFQAWYQAHHESIPPELPRYLKLPSDLQNIIMSCLAKSPEERPQSIGEILRVINPLEREYNQHNNKSRKSRTNYSVPNIENRDERKENKSSSSEVSPLSSKQTLKEIYLNSNWPKNKPQQKIVFPNLVETKKGYFASLWTMLETGEIECFKQPNTLYFHHFLFVNDPHPMILWINLLLR